MRCDQMRTKPLCSYGTPRALAKKTPLISRGFKLKDPVYITSRCGKLSWIQVWKNRKRKFTAADSSDRGTPATLSESENAECCI